MLAQEMGCGTRRVGVVGHLGRRRVDHQHGNHRQRRDADPQAAVAGKEPELVFFAVSYTHLDVYKRQVHLLANIRLIFENSHRPPAFFHVGVTILSLIHI